MSKKVLFLTNIPAPYRVDFFNELGKKCELTVLFERDTASDRNESWKADKFQNFEAIVLKGRNMNSDVALSFEVLKYLNKDFDEIIIGGYSTPTGMLAIQYLKMKKISFTLNTDGGFIKNDQGIKRKIKEYFISSATNWLVPSEVAKKYFCHYGANPTNTFMYPFSSLKEFDVLEQVPTKKQKLKLRQELGMNEEKIILSIGQFIHRKGFDVLIKAANKMPEDYGIYIIGDQPTQQYVDMKSKYQLDNVYFIDFQLKEELKRYYQAADVFAFPTREDIWGLVVNEAMANGLPVITTDKCVAGLELVTNNENGYIIETEDVNQLVEKIQLILSDYDLQEKMSCKSLEKIQEYTIEKMAEKHMEILRGV